MTIVPMTLKEANEFVTSFHRHSRAVVGHRFCIGLTGDNGLVGVAIVGRTVSRKLHADTTAEVVRVCVTEEAEKGACSMLYAACWRAWRAMGGLRLITYTLKTESGASLRGAGWKMLHEVKTNAEGWNSPSRPREWQPIYGQQKLRWEKAA
jgi:hypothetical protein